MNFVSNSRKDTENYAETLAEKIINQKQKAIIIGLDGELGTGKTVFVKAFAKKIGAKGKITSPTFTIVKKYKTKTKKYPFLFHIDAYRIKKQSEIYFLNIKKELKTPGNIFIIEWISNIKKWVPKETVHVKFFHGKTKNMRIIKK